MTPGQARTELRRLMEVLSEEALASQWYGDLEFILWDRLVHGPSRLGNVDLTEDVLIRLHTLSTNARGWLTYSEDADDLVFIDAEEWQAVYQDWLERVPAAARPRDT